MPKNAFLDKGIILGYCFFADPHYKKCSQYIHSGDTDYYATKQVEDIYDVKLHEMIKKHQLAILGNIKNVKEDYSGELTEEDVREIQNDINPSENPSWRFLRDYYQGREGQSVYEVTEGLRDLQQEIEQNAECRKSELYPMIHGWIRFAEHADVQDALKDLKEDDEEDFWICIDAHDLAATLEGETELATPNPVDFGEIGYKDEILKHTAIDDIRIVAVSRSGKSRTEV